MGQCWRAAKVDARKRLNLREMDRDDPRENRFDLSAADRKLGLEQPFIELLSLLPILELHSSLCGPRLSLEFSRCVDDGSDVSRLVADQICHAHEWAGRDLKIGLCWQIVVEGLDRLFKYGDRACESGQGTPMLGPV